MFVSLISPVHWITMLCLRAVIFRPHNLLCRGRKVICVTFFFCTNSAESHREPGGSAIAWQTGGCGFESRLVTEIFVEEIICCCFRLPESEQYRHGVPVQTVHAGCACGQMWRHQRGR